ncbi:MAG: hypothetical protein ACHQ4H_03410 [Ktedonobacterales bacterium]
MNIHPLYLAAIAACWLATYHLTYRLLSVAHDPGLVFWSVGPLGVAAVSLREPRALRVAAQLAVAGVALAAICYATLFLVSPPPIAGLGQAPLDRLAVVAAPVSAVTLAQLFAVLRERRYPLWGEARVLALAQRSAATGAHIFFTRSGRTFLHERFGATPSEFLMMVR